MFLCEECCYFQYCELQMFGQQSLIITSSQIALLMTITAESWQLVFLRFSLYDD